MSRTQASAWASLSHLYYQYNDVASAKLAAQSAYEEDAFLSNADVVLSRLFNASYDLEQIPDAVHWCAEGARRFPDDVRFVQCQLRLMVAKQVPADVPKANMKDRPICDELRRVAQSYLTISEEQR